MLMIDVQLQVQLPNLGVPPTFQPSLPYLTKQHNSDVGFTDSSQPQKLAKSKKRNSTHKGSTNPLKVQVNPTRTCYMLVSHCRSILPPKQKYDQVDWSYASLSIVFFYLDATRLEFPLLRTINAKVSHEGTLFLIS